MKKPLITVISIIAVLIGLFYALNTYIYNEKQGSETYTVAGEKIVLKNGSSSDGSITHWGNDIVGDFNRDGLEDTAFMIAQKKGSDTRYYVVAQIRTTDGIVGSEAVMIADNIHPQPMEARDGDIIVNYVDNNSVGHSIYLRLDPRSLQFGELVQNFEGESNR